MREWFEKEYWLALEYTGLYEQEYPTDFIYDMDEKGYRITCPSGQDIVVSISINDIYIGIPENRLSLTVIESICANGTAISLVVIILGGLIMESWFHKNMTGHELIIVLLSSYTNSEINL